MSKSIEPHFIYPNWPAPRHVSAIQTTRLGGYSEGNYAGLNLAEHVNDMPMTVSRNRQWLSQYLPSEPVWLNQVHGTDVIDASLAQCAISADASFTTKPHVVCVTMTADCLPVLLCDTAGSVVAAVHAGWRSLCDGVIERTVARLPVNPDQLMAWLGPAIGPDAFEVGDEVRARFMAHDIEADQAFTPKGDKWLADLYFLATQRFKRIGVTRVYGEVECTFSNPNRFYSFRRNGVTGRMASLIWINETAIGTL